MKTRLTIIALLVSCYAGAAWTDQPSQAGDNAQQPRFEQDGSSLIPLQQDHAGPPKGHKPPPQAFEDCRGKKAGDTVQHTTREGKEAAICLESPDGLVARPNNPPGIRSGDRRSQGLGSQRQPEAPDKESKEGP